MMRRPGLWVANGHPGNPAQMLNWNPAALTCFFDYLAANRVYEYKAAHPEVPIVIRFQHPLNWHENPAYYAEQLGRSVASKWNEIRPLDPYVYFANEVNLHYENGDPDPNNQHLYTTPAFYQKYAHWVQLTADIIKDITPQMKLITPPFAFGHNEDGSPDDNGNPLLGWAGYDYLYETVRDYFDNILTFHAYWGNGSGSIHEWLYDPERSSWYAFRWRRVLKLFETRYHLNAKMIIDEAGNFATSDLDFTDQLIYHAENCLKDGRVICLTYFLWLDPTNTPGNLPNSWVQGIVNLSQHLERLKNMPRVPITEYPPDEAEQTTIRVLFDDGSVQVMPLEEYLRAVVPGEMPALWPAEAVKAQAVAARSFAQYAIEHPRHPNADICTDHTHCQNYDPAKIHPNSDEAIAQTKNIIARYDGATANTIFSANCGGHTQNNEDVFAGATPIPYLRGVPCPDKDEKHGHGVGLCQYGARALAEQGLSYPDIIKHYYTGVTLGPPTSVRTSTILGTILDHTGQPAAEVKVTLTGKTYAADTMSLADGSYRLMEIPAGVYTLELPDYQVKQENITTTPGQDIVIDLMLPDPNATVTMEITRGPGLPLIVGNWLTPGEPMLFTSPTEVTNRVIAGDKPEYGSGGFETYATEIGTYILEVETYRFEIPMNGQYTQLTFRRGGPPQPAGVIEGTLTDHLNQPVANRLIYLASNTVELTDATDEQGYFLFENLPAGNYTVTVEESDLSQAMTITGQNKVTLTLQLPAPPSDGWDVEIERGPGLPLLVGDIGLANEPLVMTDPKGFQTTVTSGSKPEYGVGGFEIYAPLTGDYVVQFLDQTFTIPMHGQYTRVTFRRVEGPEEGKVLLVSTSMPRDEAETLRQGLETHPATKGLFEIVDPDDIECD
ncbi:MAG: SpoIID/LytB domain-containing protein [Anaerolineae bacterium]|nr:SpoIID/LytB domain-containing protein [Anaerolineae bacterium]